MFSRCASKSPIRMLDNCGFSSWNHFAFPRIHQYLGDGRPWPHNLLFTQGRSRLGSVTPASLNKFSQPRCIDSVNYNQLPKMDPKLKSLNVTCGIGSPNVNSVIMEEDFQSTVLPNKLRPQTQPVQSMTQHIQRRHYTPKTITQQAIDHLETIPPKAAIDSYDTLDLGFHQGTNAKPLGRPMGGIEHMYNKHSSQGTDIICLMTKIRTVYHVTSDSVREALRMLHLRHPLLRMRIKHSDVSDSGLLEFVEQSELDFDFKVSDRSDWQQYMLEELDIPLDGERKPLVRYRMLHSQKAELLQPTNTSSKMRRESCPFTSEQESKQFCFEATFLFIMHHAIMDGGYSLWMFQELVNFLDAVIMKVDIKGVKQLPLLPPMEHFFTLKSEPEVVSHQTKGLSESKCKITFSSSSVDYTVLNAYNYKFRHEINITPNKPLQNRCLVFKLKTEETRTFSRQCKADNCSPMSVITSASVLALLDLVFDDKLNNVPLEVTVPMEFMVDFRRFCDSSNLGEDAPHYPGVAAFHIPAEAQLRMDAGNITRDAFWDIARSFDDYVQNEMCTPEVLSWVQEEAGKYLKSENYDEETGKSPYVLSISNMGKLDGVLNSDVSERVRLVDLHGHSSILVDQMPLFFVTTFLLNGHFCGNVSFCVDYTSYQTAAKYVGLFQKWLGMYSKL